MLHTVSGKDAGFVKGKKNGESKRSRLNISADVLKGLLSIVEVGVAGELYLFIYLLRWRC